MQASWSVLCPAWGVSVREWGRRVRLERLESSRALHGFSPEGPAYSSRHERHLRHTAEELQQAGQQLASPAPQVTHDEAADCWGVSGPPWDVFTAFPPRMASISGDMQQPLHHAGCHGAWPGHTPVSAPRGPVQVVLEKHFADQGKSLTPAQGRNPASCLDVYKGCCPLEMIN